jgi:dsRNA-specific ribonuclease
MKRLRPQTWRFIIRPSLPSHSPFHLILTRHNSSQAAVSEFGSFEKDNQQNELPAVSTPTLRAQTYKPLPFDSTQLERMRYPSPPAQEALKSAKLNSLHARLTLPVIFSLHTLARCLVDPTADSNPAFNNYSLSILGSDIAGFHVAEYLICKYPRIPMEVLFAAQKAFIGPESMKNIAEEWGVEPVAEPGGEVDPGYLQFRKQLKTEPTYEPTEEEKRLEQDRLSLDPKWLEEQRKTEKENHVARPTRIMRWDMFGENPAEAKTLKNQDGQPVTTLERASSSFVNAVVGGLALHTGKSAARSFVQQHILSRKLDLSKLFSYAFPMKDLSNLCRREGWEEPIARIISETGRKSAHPVYVIGIFSGRDKLGEGAGGSIKEARLRAAVSALKSWYLYSPLQMTVPSDYEKKGKDLENWKPNMVDPGEIYR